MEVMDWFNYGAGPQWPGEELQLNWLPVQTSEPSVLASGPIKLFMVYIRTTWSYVSGLHVCQTTWVATSLPLCPSSSKDKTHLTPKQSYRTSVRPVPLQRGTAQFYIITPFLCCPPEACFQLSISDITGRVTVKTKLQHSLFMQYMSPSAFNRT